MHIQYTATWNLWVSGLKGLQEALANGAHCPCRGFAFMESTEAEYFCGLPWEQSNDPVRMDACSILAVIRRVAQLHVCDRSACQMQLPTITGSNTKTVLARLRQLGSIARKKKSIALLKASVSKLGTSVPAPKAPCSPMVYTWALKGFGAIIFSRQHGDWGAVSRLALASLYVPGQLKPHLCWWTFFGLSYRNEIGAICHILL